MSGVSVLWLGERRECLCVHQARQAGTVCSQHWLDVAPPFASRCFTCMCVRTLHYACVCMYSKSLSLCASMRSWTTGLFALWALSSSTSRYDDNVARLRFPPLSASSESGLVRPNYVFPNQTKWLLFVSTSIFSTASCWWRYRNATHSVTTRHVPCPWAKIKPLILALQ